MLEQAVGKEGVVDASGIIAFFNAINRVADATGTKLGEHMKNLSSFVDLSDKFYNSQSKL